MQRRFESDFKAISKQFIKKNFCLGCLIHNFSYRGSWGRIFWLPHNYVVTGMQCYSLNWLVQRKIEINYQFSKQNMCLTKAKKPRVISLVISKMWQCVCILILWEFSHSTRSIIQNLRNDIYWRVSRYICLCFINRRII